jgi:hypothetical protein
VWRRPAIVHAHAASHASFARKSLLLWLARCAGCQTIFHVEGGGFRQFATMRSGALMRRWIRHTLERSSLVIALTEGWAAFVRGFAARVELTGWLDAGAREAQLARAAVFCLPSHAEGLPMALLEAMAAGKGGVASAALARMLEDAGLQQRLGERARARVAQHYSTQAVCGRLAAIYNELAGAR